MEAKNLRALEKRWKEDIKTLSEEDDTNRMAKLTVEMHLVVVKATIKDIEEHTKALTPTRPGYAKTIGKKV